MAKKKIDYAEQEKEKINRITEYEYGKEKTGYVEQGKEKINRIDNRR